MKPLEKLHLPEVPSKEATKAAAVATTRAATSLFDEFKGFAFKGNVVDLAVGVIIGGAFGTIVKSLVDNVLMPVVSVIMPGNKGYETWEVMVGGKAIHYGRFLGDVINFLIVAAALFFFIVKFLGWIMRSKKDDVDATPSLSKDQELLTEIRDLLRDRGSEQVAEHGVGQE